MIKFARLIAKTYSYLRDDGTEDKKTNGTKKCQIKRKVKFENYKNCLEATQLDNKIKCLEKKEDIKGDRLKKDQQQNLKTWRKT